MRTAKVQRRHAGALCLPALLFLLVVQLQAGPMCGPGDRWIEGCSAGTSALWATASLTLDLGGGPEVVALEGAMVVQNLPLSGGVMETEILAMDLVGNSPVLGAVQFLAGGGLFELPPCPESGGRGSATQDLGDPLLVSSFFDIFVEIDVTPSGGDTLRLCNVLPLHLAARVDRWPPFNIQLRAAPVGLVDGDERERGTAGLALTPLYEIPEPSSLVLAGSAAMLIFFLRRRQGA